MFFISKQQLNRQFEYFFSKLNEEKKCIENFIEGLTSRYIFYRFHLQSKPIKITQSDHSIYSNKLTKH